MIHLLRKCESFAATRRRQNAEDIMKVTDAGSLVNFTRMRCSFNATFGVKRECGERFAHSQIGNDDGQTFN